MLALPQENLKDDNEITAAKSKRTMSIPIAGQALQSTAQVLNHPIVAAALQKISMNALQTVASALNQVHQEELARKSEVEKTLDQMASLRAVTENNKMPMLQDDNGSGEVEDLSGSGAESGDGEVTAVEPPKPLVEEKKKKEVVVPTNTTTPHQHHHHHHHHHRHHRHHAEKIEKKTVNSTSEMEGIDWSAIKNNTKVVGRIAQEANIPVKKLLAIFRSGASRSDIAKQTEELLNRTIESQADLAQLFENEEEESEEKKHSKKKKETALASKEKKGTEAVAKNKTSHADYEVPKNIPPNCGKLVKQYTDGELTLMDYLKELKICKKNEEVSQQLANTTPMQREAVATQNVIQHEAYNYALTSMKSFKPTAKEQANAVIARWRSNSFGEKPVTKGKPAGIPDAVKSFMNIQTPKAGKIEEGKTAAEKNTENTEVAKSNLANTATGNTVGSLISPANGDTGSSENKEANNGEPVKEQESASFTSQIAIKKSTIPETPIVQNANQPSFMSKLNMLSGDTRAFIEQTNQASQLFGTVPQHENVATAPAAASAAESQSTPVMKETTRSDILSNPTFTLNNHVPQPAFVTPTETASESENPLNNMPPAVNAVSTENIVAKSDIPIPVQKQDEILKKGMITSPKKTLLVTAPGQPNGITPVTTSLADAVLATKSIVPTITDAMSTNTLQDGSNAKQTADISLLNGQEYAQETFLASLANPALQEIPVDTSLVAALQSLNGYGSTIVNDPKSNLLMASLQKRDIKELEKRHVKRETDESVITRKHKKRHLNLPRHGKRDTSDKINSAKPIERSKMSLPLINSQRGPKLMDKIRDMSRVIATP